MVTRKIKFRARLNTNYYEFPYMLNWEELLEFYSATEMFDAGRMTLMQYTGLRDKNRKEIYEGDILVDEEGDLYEVEFDDGEFQPVLRDGATPVVSESIADMADYSSVIGNIYENADLLEERNGRNL